MSIDTFSILMSVLFVILFSLLLLMIHRGHIRQLELEREKSRLEGYSEGANWVFDMSVDEYVMHQSVRKEVKTLP